MALLAVACSPSRPGLGAGQGTTSSSVGALAVGIEHNGGTVSLRRGQLLSVTLDSTYWTLSVASGAGILAVESQSVTPGGAGCPGRTVPGSGCGTAQLVVRAEHDGGASVEGRRTTCGEALRCTPAQAVYQVRVVVTG